VTQNSGGVHGLDDPLDLPPRLRPREPAPNADQRVQRLPSGSVRMSRASI
jgi:hypothetical protein